MVVLLSSENGLLPSQNTWATSLIEKFRPEGKALYGIINLDLARAPCEGQSKFWDIIKL